MFPCLYEAVGLLNNQANLIVFFLTFLGFHLKRWIPAVKEQWSVVKTYAEPHVQLLTTKTIEVYGASKNAIAPHLSKAKEFVDPYYQVCYFILLFSLFC